jgi:excisionase family DNA binding protein
VTVTHSKWFDQCTYRCTYGRRMTYKSPFETFELSQRPRTWRDILSSKCVRVHRRFTPVLLPWNSDLEGKKIHFGICRRGVFSRLCKEFQAKGLSKLLYSVAEVATLLSCSRGTVYSLIRTGEILAVYPTSKARITANSLVRFVERMETESRSERQTQRSLTR